jgi:hypothetical protein
MKKNLLIAVISVLLFACEKEEPKTYPDSILAGQISGPGILYTDLEPNEPWSIQLSNVLILIVMALMILNLIRIHLNNPGLAMDI